MIIWYPGDAGEVDTYRGGSGLAGGGGDGQGRSRGHGMEMDSCISPSSPIHDPLLPGRATFGYAAPASAAPCRPAA
jgi:hypothetical protein